MGKRVRFKSLDCRLAIVEYVNNGRPAIQLYDAQDFELVATATINIPEFDLAHDEVIIKDYSENEGMLDALRTAGVVEETGRRAPLPFGNSAPICRLIEEAP